MLKPVVAVVSLGGTITMTSSDAAGAVAPTLTAEDLLKSVPELSTAAEVRARTLFVKPGASLSFEEVLQAHTEARKAVAEGAAGVVLVQGTDTLEETSYLLELFWDLPEPLVVTGAMRPPGHPGADGPANLLASVLTAAEPDSRERGVLVVLNDEVHAASRARKTDATATDAFSSAPFGPLARVHERSVAYANQLRRPQPLPHRELALGSGPGQDSEPGSDGERRHSPRVALLETFLGDRGELLEAAALAGCDGVVIAAFGAGHLPEPAAHVVSSVAGRIPVVLASRTGAGSVLSRTYTFPGSERDLLSRGAISAGWLDARKARLLLWSQLAIGRSFERISTEFAERGLADTLGRHH